MVARLEAAGQHAGGGWYDRAAVAALAQQLHGAHAVFLAAAVSREVVLGVDEQLALVVHARFCVVAAWSSSPIPTAEAGVLFVASAGSACRAFVIVAPHCIHHPNAAACPQLAGNIACRPLTQPLSCTVLHPSLSLSAGCQPSQEEGPARCCRWNRKRLLFQCVAQPVEETKKI